MAEAFNRVRSKLNRAIAAYLVSRGAGSVDDTVPANTTTPLNYPQTVVRATLSKPEVAFTGIRRVTVHVVIKGQAVKNPPDSAAPADTARQAFDDRVAAIYDALMQSSGHSLKATAQAVTASGRALDSDDNDATDGWTARALNTDMSDFTCSAWYDAGEGDGEPEAEGCDWVETLIFEAICSPSNVD